MKRIIAVIMTLALMFTSLTSIYAGEVTTEEDKAKVLNQLTILKGDGVDYKLNDQLKRSEAATFIVRLVGKEEIVTKDKDAYITNKFSDVESSAWYASYVGYCSQVGIISGFEDGTFRPDDYVSEKAFLKMILTALGYEYGTDFVWDTVYASAYNLKIVSDVTYKTKTEDDNTYTRSQVVEALYSSLDNKKKGSDELVITYFLEEELITSEDAVTYGLAVPDQKTEIIALEVLSDKYVQVTFNEELKDISIDKVNFINSSDDEEIEIASIQPAEQGDSWIVSISKRMLSDRTYDIYFGELVDIGGNITEDIHHTFEMPRTAVVESNYFFISDIELVDENILNVEFTHPVNNNVLDPSLYGIYKDGDLIKGNNATDIKVGLLPGTVNGVVVTVNDFVFDSSTSYMIKVSGEAVSQYGVNLNSGEGDYAKFDGAEFDRDEFGIADIVAESRTSIDIELTKPVSVNMAEKVYNYYVTTKDGTNVELDKVVITDYGTTVTLIPKVKLIDSAEYVITIVNMKDASEAKTIVGYSKTVKVDAKLKTSLEIISIESVDAVSMVVRFNKPLDADTAVNKDYYRVKTANSYAYSSSPVAVYYDEDISPDTVKLIMSDQRKMLDDTEYEIIVSNSMKDANGDSQSTSVKAEFENTYDKAREADIEEAVVVGTDTVRLTFNEEVALDVPNVLNTNYALFYTASGQQVTKTPISANYIDARTIVLKFVGLDEDVEYEIAYEQLVDYAGNVIENNNFSEKVKLQW